ncbi:hypothetical protein C2G38_2170092 [Gigaspora rosea]|uniref:Uncharacterized protein n=1 Tax=Gigaspora rosea TaxID=44941 RepID=A0A397VXW1_9GLOM|nr:hypothetical protein C2G38_2170092 [Gigaspora rosea]
MNNEKKTYLSERTLGKGTRFKSESQEKVRNNQPQRQPTRRNPRREIWCPYGRTKGYATHMGPDVRRLEQKCTALFEILTEEQAVKVQEVINKTFGTSEIREEQVPQTLNFMVKILEAITEEEEAAVNLPPSLKEDELSLKTVLGSLADAYFEVLKNLILELTKPEESESQQKSAKINLEEDKPKDREIVTEKEEIVNDKALYESDHETLVEDVEDKNEENKEDKSKVPLEGEALHHASEEWIRKVDEFRKIS